MNEDRKIQYKELNGVVYGAVSLPATVLGAWIENEITHVRFESYEKDGKLILSPLRFESGIMKE